MNFDQDRICAAKRPDWTPNEALTGPSFWNLNRV